MAKPRCKVELAMLGSWTTSYGTVWLWLSYFFYQNWLPRPIAYSQKLYLQVFFKQRSDHCHAFSINHRVLLCKSIFIPVFWECGDVEWVVGLQLDDDTHKRRSNQSVPRRPWYGEACFLLPGRILDLIFVILKPVFGLLLQCRSFIAPTVSDSYKRSKYGKSYPDQGRVSASKRFWRCA